MGGYFLPTSIGPNTFMPGVAGEGWVSVANTAIGALAPVLARIGGSTAVQKVGGVLAKAIPPLVGGAAVGAGIGAGSSLTDEIIKRLTSGTPIFGRPRKRRRMNVCNARALRRSIRRVQGFSKFARRSFQLEKRVRIKKRRR